MANCRLAWLLLLPAVASQRACFDYGSGNQDPNSIPCFPDAEVSHCCAPNDICYSNSLCRTTANNTFTQYFIGLCTDTSIPSPECAAERACKVDQNSNGVGVTDCGNGQYCCYGLSGCDCNDDSQIFSLPGGSIVTTLPATVPPIASSTTTTPATGPATTTTATTTAATASPTNHSNNDNSAVPIGVGVGVGVGVALILVAAAIWFFMRRRKRSRMDAAGPPPEQQSFMANQHGFQGNQSQGFADTGYGSDPKYVGQASPQPIPPKPAFNDSEAFEAGPYQLDAAPTTHELPADLREHP